MRSAEDKMFVNVKTGIVYHKPVKVNGLEYKAPGDFYEITPEQAERLDSGEPLRSVLREGIREKVEAQLSGALKEEAPAAPAAPVAPVTPDLTDVDESEVDSFTTHKEIDAYAASKGLEIPAGYTTIQLKKDFINTALLAG